MPTMVEISEIARNWAIVVGGGVGLGVAIWRGWAANRQAGAALQQAEIGRRDHITELFTNAVSLLHNDRLEIRLGAIYPPFPK